VIKLIKAVIWDLYGTLFFSKKNKRAIDPASYDNLKRGMEYLNDNYNLDINPDNGIKYYREIVEKLHNKRVKKQPGLQHPELDIMKLWQIFFSDYLNKAINEKKAREIALNFEKAVNPVYVPQKNINLLKYLLKKNIIQGVLSNCQFYSLKILEEEIGELNRYFEDDLFVLSYKTKAAKPDKKIYEKLLEKIEKKNILPEESIMIGNDLDNDIIPLKKREFNTIYVTDTNDYSEYADYIVHEIRQMYEIFENLI